MTEQNYEQSFVEQTSEQDVSDQLQSISNLYLIK